MAKKPAKCYEERIILFVDFLGFKELVEETAKDNRTLNKLLNALEAIGELAEKDTFESKRTSQFSDSVVVSYSVSEPSGVFWMLNSIALTVIRLTELGYLLRGAVTVGQLYHSDNYVVGPAMVEAYEMESKNAKFPRVIVDPKVIRLARTHRAEHHSPKEEEDYVRSYLTEDQDGYLYLDYVSWEKVVHVAGGDDDGYGEYLLSISRMLERGLSHEVPSVREKYLWLYRHYIKVLDDFDAMPADHRYRAQSPEVCALIESLPRFEDLAEKQKKAKVTQR